LKLTPSTSGEVVLKHGEIVQGTVQKVEADGQAVVSIKGALLEATTEIPLQEGDKLSFIVDTHGDRILLRLATMEALTDLTRQHIAEALNSLGIPARPEIVDVGIALLQSQLPVNAENMQEMAKLTRMLGGPGPTNTAVAVMALQQGLSDPQQVEMLRNFFQTPETIRPAANLYQAVQALKQEAAKFPLPPEFSPPLPLTGAAEAETTVYARPAETMTAGSPATPLLAATGKEQSLTAPAAATVLPAHLTAETTLPASATTAAAVATGTATPTPSAAENPVPLPLLLPLEPEPAASQLNARHTAIREGLESLREQLTFPAGTTLSREQTAGLLRSLSGLMDDLVKTIIVESEQPPEHIRAALQDKARFSPELTRNVQLATELLQNPALKEHFPLMQELLSALNDWERSWSAERLHNTLNFNSPTQPNATPEILYFSLPVMANEKPFLCELKLHRDATEGGRDASSDQMTVAVGLHTAHMGEVVFHVDWKRDQFLSLTGVVGREEVKTYLDSTMSDLLAELKEAGQEARYLGIKVSRDAVRLKPAAAETQTAFRPQGIDIRV
jgi:hypothetical protein